MGKTDPKEEGASDLNRHVSKEDTVNIARS
jgi:hypothetical protein